MFSISITVFILDALPLISKIMAKLLTLLCLFLIITDVKKIRDAYMVYKSLYI